MFALDFSHDNTFFFRIISSSTVVDSFDGSEEKQKR